MPLITQIAIGNDEVVKVLHAEGAPFIILVLEDESEIIIPMNVVQLIAMHAAPVAAKET
jgi:hypothetical protein